MILDSSLLDIPSDWPISEQVNGTPAPAPRYGIKGKKRKDVFVGYGKIAWWYYRRRTLEVYGIQDGEHIASIPLKEFGREPKFIVCRHIIFCQDYKGGLALVRLAQDGEYTVAHRMMAPADGIAISERAERIMLGGRICDFALNDVRHKLGFYPQTIGRDVDKIVISSGRNSYTRGEWGIINWDDDDTPWRPGPSLPEKHSPMLLTEDSAIYRVDTMEDPKLVAMAMGEEVDREQYTIPLTHPSHRAFGHKDQLLVEDYDYQTRDSWLRAYSLSDGQLTNEFNISEMLRACDFGIGDADCGAIGEWQVHLDQLLFWRRITWHDLLKGYQLCRLNINTISVGSVGIWRNPPEDREYRDCTVMDIGDNWVLVGLYGERYLIGPQCET